MPQPDHEHSLACSCAAHQHHAQSQAEHAGWWASFLPALACAFCPAHLAFFAKIFSLGGVSFGLLDEYHELILLVAIGVSLAVSAWRSKVTQRVWPIAIAAVGSLLVLLGHAAGHWPLLEWSGMFVLFFGGLSEHFRLRRLEKASSSFSIAH